MNFLPIFIPNFLHLLSSLRRRDPEVAQPAAKSTPTSPPSGTLALTLMVRMSALRELQPWLMRLWRWLRRVAITFLPNFLPTFLHLLSLPRRRDPEAALPAAKSTPTSPPSGMLALTLMARMSALRELQPWLMRQKSSLRRVAITFLPIFIQNFLQTFLHLLSSPRRRDPEAALPTAKSTPTSPPSGTLALKLMARKNALLKLKPWLVRQWMSEPFTL